MTETLQRRQYNKGTKVQHYDRINKATQYRDSITTEPRQQQHNTETALRQNQHSNITQGQHNDRSNTTATKH